MPTEPVYCARHPKVQTALACARCATPICPDCLVPGPVGMLCRNCANLGGSPLFQIRPERFVLAIVAGIVSGGIAGILLQRIGFFIFFAAPVIGGILGEIVLRAVGYKRGVKVEWVTGGSILVGAALSLLVTGTDLLFAPVSLILFAVSVLLVVIAAVGKIRW
ncbi:MAG: hypothetical protein H7145_06990 [Akkermansiaceae bacterium]|nr:hypothetical protein [Armatimonadota bacterium]